MQSSERRKPYGIGDDHVQPSKLFNGSLDSVGTVGLAPGILYSR